MKMKLILKYIKYKLSFIPLYETKIITVESDNEEETCNAHNSYKLCNIKHFQDRKPAGVEFKNYSTMYFQREVFISKETIKEYYKL